MAIVVGRRVEMPRMKRERNPFGTRGKIGEDFFLLRWKQKLVVANQWSFNGY